MYNVGFMVNAPFIYKTSKKECPDGSVWVVMIEEERYVKIFIHGTKNDGKKINKQYSFRNNRYLAYNEIPAILRRSPWIWTTIQILDSIASKYK